MMARAVEQRWPMSAKNRDAIVKVLLNILVSSDSSPREKTSAAKALMAAEKQNQEDEHKVVDVVISERNHRLDAIAADLGIEQDLIEIVSREAIGGDSGDESITAKSADAVRREVL